MAWRRPGDKPLSDPMMVSVLTHICVTWPQWVKLSCQNILASTSKCHNLLSRYWSILFNNLTIYRRINVQAISLTFLLTGHFVSWNVKLVKHEYMFYLSLSHYTLYKPSYFDILSGKIFICLSIIGYSIFILQDGMLEAVISNECVNIYNQEWLNRWNTSRHKETSFDFLVHKIPISC